MRMRLILEVERDDHEELLSVIDGHPPDTGTVSNPIPMNESEHKMDVVQENNIIAHSVTFANVRLILGHPLQIPKSTSYI